MSSPTRRAPRQLDEETFDLEDQPGEHDHLQVKPPRAGITVRTHMRVGGTMHDMQMTPIRNLRG